MKRSLDTFERVFNEFTDPMDAGPFADGGLPGHEAVRVAGRRAGSGSETAARWREDAEMPGPPPPGLGPGPPHHSAEEAFRSGPGPMLRGKMGLSPKELKVLEIVLRFYDGFAERNKTNSQLRGRPRGPIARSPPCIASWAARRRRSRPTCGPWGDFQNRWSAATARIPNTAYELARTLALDGPGVERRLAGAGRARPATRDRDGRALFERAPERKRITYAAALARWNGSLAEHLESLGRPEEAVESYRDSIGHDEWLADQLSDPPMIREVLAFHRAALADALIRIGARRTRRGRSSIGPRPTCSATSAKTAEPCAGRPSWSPSASSRSPRPIAGWVTIGGTAELEEVSRLLREHSPRRTARP